MGYLLCDETNIERLMHNRFCDVGDDLVSKLPLPDAEIFSDCLLTRHVSTSLSPTSPAYETLPQQSSSGAYPSDP